MEQTLQAKLEALDLSFPNKNLIFTETILDHLKTNPPENINLSNINLTDIEKNELVQFISNPGMALNHRSRELLRTIAPFITMPAPEIQGGRRKSRRSRRSRRRRRTRRY